MMPALISAVNVLIDGCFLCRGSYSLCYISVVYLFSLVYILLLLCKILGNSFSLPLIDNSFTTVSNYFSKTTINAAPRHNLQTSSQFCPRFAVYFKVHSQNKPTSFSLLYKLYTLNYKLNQGQSYLPDLVYWLRSSV